VAVRDGAPVRLREIAASRTAWRRVRQIVRVNGKPGMRLAVNKQSGANTVEVARRSWEIERINHDMPQIRVVPIIDSSDYIQRSITQRRHRGCTAACLAVVVLLLFLRRRPQHGRHRHGDPVSIVATFMLMHFGGFTLNLMTLGGLALAVGMLVDSSIVVLENITGCGRAAWAARGRGEGQPTRSPRGHPRQHADHLGRVPAAGLRARHLGRHVQAAGATW
jgi:hydrophobic/amphiphilic exporter-1 (mainly G- bacteria), HAE1 family